MQTVISKDGTKIAYDRFGDGAPVILVDGVFGTRANFGLADVAKLLGRDFSAILYDRRGRGDSTDTQPYAVEREIEDIAALIEAVGGSASVYGISSGAVLALRAAWQLSGVTKLAIYEPPLIVDEGHARPPANLIDRLQALIAQGKRSEVVKTFVIEGMGGPRIAGLIMPLLPFWSKMTEVAHTVVYDLAVMGDFSLSPELSRAMGGLKIPALVMAGAKSPAWMQHTAQAVAGCIPGSEIRLLAGQTHEVKPGAIAPEVASFFKR